MIYNRYPCTLEAAVGGYTRYPQSPKWHEISTWEQLNQALSSSELELEGDPQHFLPQTLLLVSQVSLATREFGSFSLAEKRAKPLGNMCNAEQDLLHWC